jgi:hypothetical protein
MRIFKDARGREWTLAITVAAMAEVRARTGCDLYRLFDDDGKGLSDLLSDPPALCTVCHHLSTADVPDSEFAAGIDGDALERLADAFLEELIDFFPSPTREPRRKLLAKGKAIAAALLTRGEAQLDKVDPQQAAEQIARSLRGSGSPGSSPGAADWTPGPSPSASSPGPPSPASAPSGSAAPPS